MAKFRVAVQHPPDVQTRRRLAAAWAGFLSAILVVVGLALLIGLGH